MPLNETQQNTESTLNAPCRKQIEGKFSSSTHKMAILPSWGNPLLFPLIPDLAESLAGDGELSVRGVWSWKPNKQNRLKKTRLC